MLIAKGVAVPSNDHPARGNISGGRGCGIRHIERGEVAATRTEEAMRYATRVEVRSDDQSSRSYGARHRECGVRGIEHNKGGLRWDEWPLAEI